MGAHALGSAAYAVKAASLAAPDRPEVVDNEIGWQLTHMTGEVRAALRALPPVGENSSGPLGPGLLASGQLGTIIRNIQAALGEAGRLAEEVPSPFCDGPLVGPGPDDVLGTHHA